MCCQQGQKGCLHTCACVYTLLEIFKIGTADGILKLYADTCRLRRISINMSLLEAQVDSAVASQQTPALVDASERTAAGSSSVQQADQVVEQPLSTAPSVSDGIEEIDVETPRPLRDDSQSNRLCSWSSLDSIDVQGFCQNCLALTYIFEIEISAIVRLIKVCCIVQGGGSEQITRICKKALPNTIRPHLQALGRGRRLIEA